MLSRKNISPNLLASLSALVIASICTITVFVFSSNLNELIILFSIVGIASYALIYYILERFIYRKIKLIYKFITHTKATKREEFFTNELLPQKTLDEVKEDVEKWAEERKGEIERLQNNEQYRREFLMNLAHELKTPIFAAQGYIDTLMDGALNDDTVNVLFLQKASKSIDRLSDLVTDLDEISNIESNRVPINQKDFIIQDLIQDVFEELSQKAQLKGIHCFIKKGCEQGIRVHADNQKIKQVLVNLIDNSIKYGKEQGETTAGIYVVDNRQVLIEITDNGTGISDEQVPRVFERFYRTDSARSRNAGGTGLGLAIVKHIIEAHNQSVICRSTLDVGTTFGFTLEKSKN